MFWSPECIFQVPNRGPPPTRPGEAGRLSRACRMGGPGPLWLPGGGEAAVPQERGREGWGPGESSVVGFMLL